MARRKRKKVSHVEKWYIALYIRLSKNHTNDESESVSNQKLMLSEYCKRRFTDIEYEIVDYYIDDGQTGTDDDDRVNFVRMIEDIKEHKINLVICKELSRAFRNHSDQGHYLEDFFPRHNIEFISTGGCPAVDTIKDPQSVYTFEVPMNGIVNDRFAYKTSIEVRRVFDEKRKQGLFIGAFAKYGYEKSKEDKNVLVIDKEASKIVLQIGEWLGYDAKSTMWVANKLNEMGIPNPSTYKKLKGLNYKNCHLKGSLWSASTVSRIGRDEAYLGHMIQGKYRIVSYKIHEQQQVPKKEWYRKENKFEPIFTQELYNLIQKNLDRTPKRSNKAKKEYLFSSYVFCADCGYAMHRKMAKNIAYLHCSTYTSRSKTHCTKHTIREDVLEEIVLKAIQEEIKKVKNISHLIDKIKSDVKEKPKTEYMDKQIKNNQKIINKNKSILDRLYFDLVENLINKEQYVRMKEQLEIEIQEVEDRNKKLKEEKITLENNEGATNTYIKTFLKYKNIKKLNRGMLQALVDKIEVTNERKVIITFEFQEQINNIEQFIEENMK
ncbi:recombinase family protein [Thomasclavelia cocleata]|uniref:recombinase family protein n=1 Tax=Thomasclavelia cocleata TaxID=69824 RepID=UPI0025700F5A|nr:recombinase family protein [Thomasclavelia cocleata]